MFANSNCPGGGVVEFDGDATHRRFGTTVATAPLIRGLQEHVAQDVRFGSQSAWIKFVLALDELDFLAPSDWAKSNVPAHIGLKALQRIVTQRVGTLHRLKCRFQFHGLLDHGREAMYSDQASALLSNRNLEANRDYLVFSVVVEEKVDCYTLKRRITRLEKSVPGLGSAVLDWISRASTRTVGVLTPEVVLHLVSDMQWLGEDDEGELLAQWRSEGMTEEEINNNEFLRRADLEAEFPEYVLRPSCKLSRAKRQQLARYCSPWLRQVVVALAQVERLIMSHDARLLSLAEIEATSMYVAVALRWHERDLSVRVYDDWIDYWMQGGEATECQGLEAVALEPVAVREFLKRLDLGLQLLTALDRLITLVSEPEREERKGEDNEGSG